MMKSLLFREIVGIVGKHAIKAAKIPLACAKEVVGLVEDHYYDRKLGIETCYDYSAEEDRGLYTDGILYKPTGYRRLRATIEHLNLGADDTFVDIGCGKGRVVFLAATYPVKKVIGIELRKTIVMIAMLNSRRVRRKKAEIEIVHGDAAGFDMSAGTVFFMYDPFGYKTFVQVIENIRRSLEIRPRPIRIAYFDPRYRDYLDAAGWLKPHGEIKPGLRVFVWSVEP